MLSPLNRRHSPALARRGSLRLPGADLRKLPVGLDLAGVSIAEGLRAAVASGAVLVINIWVGSPALMFAAFAANLTCFSDVGGALRDRVRALLTFTMLGAVLWSGLGLLHAFGLAVLLPATALVVFCNSMARVWGVRAQAVGNLLTVVLALAVDRGLDPPVAGMLFASFIAGGAWAILLTIGIWRINPERPVTRMVASNWQLLAAFARDLIEILDHARERDLAAFEAHARAHRRALREALEASRAALPSAVRAPGPISGSLARNLLMVEAQDRVFGALIALSDILEYSATPALATAARALLRRLRPLFSLLARGALPRPARLEPLLARMKTTAARHPGLADVGTILAERLRAAVRLEEEEAGVVSADFGLQNTPVAEHWLVPLRANLTWSSAILRHAVRAVVLTVAAVAISLTWWSVYAHWLTITVALTMQPYFAATWQRALERIGGTLLGALLGGGLAFFPQTPLVSSLLMVPLSVIGFSVRQVSYGAYVACLTPLVVILFDVAEPGHPEWVIATMRTLYTVGGGAVAVLACMVLWPSWEPDRTAQGLRTALKAHARYAEALFRAPDADAPGVLEVARRAAGVSSNNLEASLSRALQEPRRRHDRGLESILAADAALRRLAGALVVLQHDTHLRLDEATAWAEWGRWLPATLDALAAVTPRRPATPPEAPPESLLARVGRVVEVLADTVQDRAVAESQLSQAPAASPHATRPGTGR